MAYAEYLKTARWRFLRGAALARDGYACRVCNSRKRLEVHHRWYPRVLGTEDVSALTTLCHSCHSLFSRRRPKFHRNVLVAAACLTFSLWLATRLF